MSKVAIRQGLNWVALGAALLGLAVMLGAFGAHGLKSMVSPAKLATFQVAVQYHMYHGLGIVLIGIVKLHLPEQALQWAGRLLCGGIFLFSGSLYAMTFVHLPGLGLMTPFGGGLFIVGWVAFVIGVLRHRPQVSER